MVDEFLLTEAPLTDGLGVLKMLWEIGPGENGFGLGAYRENIWVIHAKSPIGIPVTTLRNSFSGVKSSL